MQNGKNSGEFVTVQTGCNVAGIVPVWTVTGFRPGFARDSYRCEESYMKLSMWSIANRLSSFDLELNISEQAPPTLNSARLAYATNCVHVYPEQDYVVCNGEGDIIKIHNINLTEAFEIIQGTFDYFEDWIQSVIDALDEGNYQEVISLSWQVFRNPLVLFDGNHKVLGITKQYGARDLDSEWEYLYQYGYSSLNAVNMMRHQYSNISFHRHGFQPYQFGGSQMMKYPGVFYGMYHNDMSCGHINLLARDRALNEGDYQLLEQLARLLEPYLGQIRHNIAQNNNNVFYNIIFGTPCDEKALSTQMHYQQWGPDDVYHLALIRLDQEPDKKSQRVSLDALAHLVTQKAAQCIVLKKAPCILMLANYDIHANGPAMGFLQDLMRNNPVTVGLSLPCKGLKQANRLYKQAKSAIFYGSLFRPEEKLYHFFDYAFDFIVDSPSLSDCVCACMPGIVELWDMQQSSGDELLSTLRCFLDQERSASRTAAKLFTHRNTILYRIQKIQDILKCSLEEVYVRDYCRVSMKALELYHRKTAMGGEADCPMDVLSKKGRHGRRQVCPPWQGGA